MIAFKYRSLSSTFDPIGLVRDNQLYASSVGVLNDLLETVIDDSMSRELNTLKPILNKTEDILQQWNDLNAKKKTIGIFSLSKSNFDYPDNSVMWSMYADTHKGFCLGYDVDRLLDSEEFLFNVNKVDVDYEENVPVISISDIKTNTLLTKLFASKCKDWAYEREIRLIYETNGLKTYNPVALKSVYLGISMDEENKQKIIESLQGKDVDVYQMEHTPSSYNLRFKQICSLRRKVKNKLPVSSYEILVTDHNHSVENFFVWYKNPDKSEQTLYFFVKKFREIHSTKQSNVYLFEKPINKALYTKYPLSDAEDALFNNLISI